MPFTRPGLRGPPHRSLKHAELSQTNHPSLPARHLFLAARVRIFSASLGNRKAAHQNNAASLK
jgi:hypothetical protein